mgnify:CR=1 FL=1
MIKLIFLLTFFFGGAHNGLAEENIFAMPSSCAEGDREHPLEDLQCGLDELLNDRFTDHEGEDLDGLPDFPGAGGHSGPLPPFRGGPMGTGGGFTSGTANQRPTPARKPGTKPRTNMLLMGKPGVPTPVIRTRTRGAVR